MEKFYYKLREETLAYRYAPKLPEGFFSPRKEEPKEEPKEKTLEEVLIEEYEEQEKNAHANDYDDQMLKTLKGGKY